jgi:uncharacterized protein (TIGR02996 family)
MDDRRALMAAIIANPDEDTPRLALADWLDEHGDVHDRARAEFIRAQIRAAQLPAGPERKKLNTRASKLARQHQNAWLAPLEAADAWAPRQDTDFTRGLLKYLFLDTSDFLLKARQAALPDALAATGLEELCFFSATKRIADLAGSPALRWVARVQYPGADDAALGAFARAPNMAHLSGLELEGVRFTDAGLRAFADTTGTANLRAVIITPRGGLSEPKTRFSAAGVLALFNSRRLPRLDRLDLAVSTGARFDTQAFFADAGLKKLRELSFQVPVPAAQVVSCPHLVNLRVLHLEDTTVTPADVDALLASPTFAQLKELSLALPGRVPSASAKKLRARFGTGLKLEYSD